MIEVGIGIMIVNLAVVATPRDDGVGQDGSSSLIQRAEDSLGSILWGH